MPYINKDPLKELHDKLLKESKEKQKKNSIKN